MFFSRRADEGVLGIFRTFSQNLSSITDLKQLLKNLLKALTEVAAVKNGAILLFEAERKALVVRESVGGEPLISQFDLQDPFVNFLRRTAQPVTKHEILANRHLMDIKEAAIHFLTAVNAEVVFPLSWENRILGFVALGSRKDSKAYSRESLDLLAILLNLAAVSIHHAVLYESMSRQNSKLSEMAALKTQFVNTVTHELRTPLNGILGLTEILLDAESSPNLNDDQRRYVEMIRSAGEELLGLVNDILDLAQFQSKWTAPQVKKVDLRKLLKELTPEVSSAAEDKRVEFRAELGSQTTVYGDESQIRQLLHCLMENAVKFSREDRLNVVRILASRQGDMLKLGVLDRGIGIEEKDQELIFEDFRQGDGALTRGYGGTGVGLAIAKKIVEGHGGRIWVESKKGEGSHFYCTLPVKPGGVAAQAESGAHSKKTDNALG
jgi:signal transduction histidine kinase